MTTTYLMLNRFPTVALVESNSCFHVLHNKDSNYKSISVFGLSCFPLLLRPYNRDELEFRIVEYVYLGLSPQEMCMMMRYMT